MKLWMDCIEIPQGPGLGVEVDEDGIKENSYDGRWGTPTAFFKDDNSFAQW